MVKNKKWQLQEAKNKFTQLAEEADLYGPQVVSQGGRDVVVILSAADYERLRQRKTDLVDFLANSPLRGSGIEMDRDPAGGRDVNSWMDLG